MLPVTKSARLSWSNLPKSLKSAIIAADFLLKIIGKEYFVANNATCAQFSLSNVLHARTLSNALFDFRSLVIMARYLQLPLMLALIAVLFAPLAHKMLATAGAGSLRFLAWLVVSVVAILLTLVRAIDAEPASMLWLDQFPHCSQIFIRSPKKEIPDSLWRLLFRQNPRPSGIMEKKKRLPGRSA